MSDDKCPKCGAAMDGGEDRAVTTWPGTHIIDGVPCLLRQLAAKDNRIAEYADLLSQAAAMHEEDMAENERLREALVDFRDNYDCDSDAHKYGTRCRRCTARDVLDRTREAAEAEKESHGEPDKPYDFDITIGRPASKRAEKDGGE